MSLLQSLSHITTRKQETRNRTTDTFHHKVTTLPLDQSNGNNELKRDVERKKIYNNVEHSSLWWKYGLPYMDVALTCKGS